MTSKKGQVSLGNKVVVSVGSGALKKSSALCWLPGPLLLCSCPIPEGFFQGEHPPGKVLSLR